LIAVHNELHRQRRLLTEIEDHRTYGWGGRLSSATWQAARVRANNTVSHSISVIRFLSLIVSPAMCCVDSGA